MRKELAMNRLLRSDPDSVLKFFSGPHFVIAINELGMIRSEERIVRNEGLRSFQEDFNKRLTVGESEFDEGRWLSRRHQDTEMNGNEIGTLVVDCAVELHRDLGPGLLERVYEVTLARALERRWAECPAPNRRRH